MTPPEPPDPAVGPQESEDQETVRRLLAEAGGPVVTPPEVRARLDQTLAGLLATRADPAPGQPATDQPATDRAATGQPATAAPAERPQATVTDLAEAGRRRRRWPAVAVAAASALVLGYGVSAVIQETRWGGGSDDSAAEAGAGAGTTGADTEDAAGEAAGDAPGEAGGGGAVPAPSSRVQRGLPKLAEVPDVTAAFPALRGASPSWDSELGAAALGPWALTTRGVAGAPSPGPEPVVACADPPTAAGDQAYRVRFRGRPATMVLGPADQRRRVAVVYGCATARPLAAAVLRVG